MKKIIKDGYIYFYDDNDVEIMYMNHSLDDFIWYFNTSDVIKVTPDSDLYALLSNFMNQRYVFSDDILKNHKSDNKLVWYSDCYYNPDDEWSIDSVSCLHIEKEDGFFNIWCSKKLDERISRAHKEYCIAFSPSGNGKYSRNIDTNFTLQDEFVVMVYQGLLEKNKVLKK